MPKLENGEPTEKALTALQHEIRTEVDGDKFSADASVLLRTLAPLVMSEIVPELELYYGRWHPSGLMVYVLGTHKDLGILRFHVWPKGLRKRIKKGLGQMGNIFDGDIHNHAWYITSLAMKYYSDDIYNVLPVNELNLTDAEVIERELYRVFNVTYEENVRQALTPNGSYVTAIVSQSRVTHKGDIHTIAPGIYHAPTVPFEMLGSTLVFDSFRATDGPDILIRGANEPIYDTRQTISKEEAILAKNQLLSDID
jgi:hypothetical protein